MISMKGWVKVTAQPDVSPQEMTLEDCMLAYQAGDPLAFEEIYRRTVGRSRAWLRSRSSSTERAEDLIQKAYLKLHRARHQYRSGEIFEAWFFTILRNVWVDELRKDGRTPDRSHTVSIEEAPESALAVVDQLQERREEESRGVSDVMENLPEHHREALEMRYQEDTDFDGLARHWKISEAAARKRVSRAVQALKEKLGGTRTSQKQEGKSS